MLSEIDKINSDLSVIKERLNVIDIYLNEDSKKTEDLITLNQTIKEFIINTDERINDLKETYILNSKNTELLSQRVDKNFKLIKDIIDILQNNK